MLSSAFDIIIQIILQFTPHGAFHAFEAPNDILRMLNERRGWAIDAYRSCFNINLPRNNSFATLCTLVFLAMAETMHLCYGRLSPTQLMGRIDAIGHENFAIMNAIPELGVIVVRIIEILAMSDSPVTAASLALVGCLPVIGLQVPALLHFMKTLSEVASRTILRVVEFLQKWMHRFRSQEGGSEGGTSIVGDSPA
ncbi:hypothetical protein PAXRUDRAFT_830401 [Paxillus rubicundulus Ve08.2h10]|uniref:Uncharacterized protein n=1 Tax=Paxillus rubicundulus Ve08.2h10 TaxID=930991 RepID=A0A0D0DYY2_9AGAM|nr:hypothetical protein PAXRUDRAFT_830401 [Paxillus rubicundulus Ve08.2h10]